MRLTRGLRNALYIIGGIVCFKHTGLNGFVSYIAGSAVTCVIAGSILEEMTSK